jgi:phosphonate transport system ATP-binding protein
LVAKEADLSAAAIEVIGLCKNYAGRAVLSDISFRIDPGEIVALLGPSGAGKTTLFRCLTRLVEPDRGQIIWFGHTATGMRPRDLRRARRNIGLIFQQHNLIRRRSALDNALAGRLGRVSLWRAVARRFDKADRQRALAALDRVQLLDFAARRADRLSGGQQQRVAIARVLVQESLLILADEPVASLDPSTAVSVLALLREVAHENGVAVLCSLHQVDLVPGFADRVLGLRNGQLASDTPITEFSRMTSTEIYAAMVGDHHR